MSQVHAGAWKAAYGDGKEPEKSGRKYGRNNKITTGWYLFKATEFEGEINRNTLHRTPHNVYLDEITAFTILVGVEIGLIERQNLHKFWYSSFTKEGTMVKDRDHLGHGCLVSRWENGWVARLALAFETIRMVREDVQVYQPT